MGGISFCYLNQDKDIQSGEIIDLKKYFLSGWSHNDYMPLSDAESKCKLEYEWAQNHTPCVLSDFFYERKRYGWDKPQGKNLYGAFSQTLASDGKFQKDLADRWGIGLEEPIEEDQEAGQKLQNTVLKTSTSNFPQEYCHSEQALLCFLRNRSDYLDDPLVVDFLKTKPDLTHIVLHCTSYYDACPRCLTSFIRESENGKGFFQALKEKMYSRGYLSKEQAKNLKIRIFISSVKVYPPYERDMSKTSRKNYNVNGGGQLGTFVSLNDEYSVFKFAFE